MKLSGRKSIQRAGMEMDRTISAQELLRELLDLATLLANPVRHAWQETLYVLDELKTHHHLNK